MDIRDSKRDKRRPNEYYDKDGKMRHFKDGYVDSTGRKQTTYSLNKHSSSDKKEMIRDIDEYVIRYCDKNAIDFRFVDKLKLIKKLSPSLYRRYCNAYQGYEKM